MFNIQVVFLSPADPETWVSRQIPYTNERGLAAFTIEINEDNFDRLPEAMRFTVLQHEMGHAYAAYLADR